jgi:hypothetical protein
MNRTDKPSQQMRSCVTHSTKKNLLICLGIWVVGNSMLILAMTDLLNENFFKKEYLMIYLIIATSTWTMYRVFTNYLKIKKNEDLRVS